MRDVVDDCPDTVDGADVDRAGCSLAQFCAQIDATTAKGHRACKRADWRNDAPLMKVATEGDCAVDLWALASDPIDDMCLPAIP